MNPLVALYPGTESALYRVTGLVADICTQNIDALAAYKQKYTLKFVGELQQSATDAKNLPNHSTRQGALSALHNTLVEANSGFCSVFAGLMGYIDDSFPAAQVAANKKMAGGDLYISALKENWSATSIMTGTGATFISNNTDALTAGGMPVDFADSFSNAADAFETSLSAFSNYKNGAQGETNAKIIANNNLYSSLLAILKDARYVLGTDMASKKAFSYSAQLKKVKGPGKTGIRMVLQMKDVLTPVTTATVSLMPTGKSFDANNKGVVEAALPENTYSYTITAPGLATITGTLAITAGVMSRKKIEMTTAADREATA